MNGSDMRRKSMGKYNDWAEKKAAEIERMRAQGGQAVREAASDSPGVDIGYFDYDEWTPGTAYKKGDVFTHNGKCGFCRQAVNSLEIYPPFSVGTEALYGARPAADIDGVYPYVYNMRAEAGMKVRSAKDGEVYTCIQPADPLLLDPADAPAHFTK